MSGIDGHFCIICGKLMPYSPNSNICCSCKDALKRNGYKQVKPYGETESYSGHVPSRKEICERVVDRLEALGYLKLIITGNETYTETTWKILI